ncbi:hypothetical protein [Vulgatibacter sp.]|uniref:hypothetical protein n=1 Tax=Vulgatibacter sp. TaxID=1971226 RepID=UPI00356807E2
MELRTEAIIDHPRDVVFRVYRDKLPDLIPYLPNVRGIEVKSRSEKGPVVELVNVWHGGGDIPAAVRSILSDSVLSWTDYAEWNEDEHSCKWRSESHSFKEAVDSRGKNLFVEQGPNRMVIRIEGRIDVDAAKVPGVPRLIAGKAGKLIEGFLIKQVQDNLQEVARGVGRYLRETGGR